MRDWLHEKLGKFIDVNEFIADERFVFASGAAVTSQDPYRANTFIWFHRDLPHEIPVPGEMPIIYRDERLVVVDKPPFLSTIPRGRHIVQSVVVRLRAELGLPELTPAHRLDRVTSGVLLLTTERQWRGPYQQALQEQRMQKTYRALAQTDERLREPIEVRNHLYKEHGEHRVQVIDGAPANAASTVVLEESHGDTSVYRLTPHTGKTHQLRQHMASLGVPILGDPLYPEVTPVAVDDFSDPLQLLASELEFVDPLDGRTRHFVSERPFPITGH